MFGVNFRFGMLLVFAAMSAFFAVVIDPERRVPRALHAAAAVFYFGIAMAMATL